MLQLYNSCSWHPPAHPVVTSVARCKVSCSAFPVQSIDHNSRPVTYIKRSVREDEHVEAPGSVVVHGDVAADASIEAAGNVMVWGRLSGHVHAGCTGDHSAVISALELRGAQLVIANSTSLGAARITVPGPHTASVLQVGRNLTMNLTPLGPSHPPLNPIGLTSSVKRWLCWYPAAAAALFTGCYAMLAGLALLLAPKTVLGLLFDASQVPSIWIRVGGVLFATFGAQYLGTAIADYRQVLTASNSSSGCPDMPFRPASPHPAPAAPKGGAHTAPAAVAASYQSHPASTATAGWMPSTAGALLHDSSTAYSASTSSSSSTEGAGSSSDSSSDGSREVPVGRSVPADRLTKDQIEHLRQTHKRRSRAAASAAAAGGGGSSSNHSLQGQQQQEPQRVGVHNHSQQQQQEQQEPLQQPLQHQQPPTWAYVSSGFYEASVWSRLGLAVAFTLLVAACRGPPGLLVLALVNLLGALSMWGALRRQWLMHVMGDMPETAGVSAN